MYVYINLLIESAFFPFVLPIMKWYFTKEYLTDSKSLGEKRTIQSHERSKDYRFL